MSTSLKKALPPNNWNRAGSSAGGIFSSAVIVLVSTSRNR
jgi:hypothetical protein